MQKNALKKQFLKRLKKAAGSPCILCGKPSVAGGTFYPDDPEKFGVQKGKMRIFFYGLCDECMLDLNASKKVAEKFLHEY